MQDVITRNVITDQVLVVRASDKCGSSAYSFVTIRVIPQSTRVNFLMVYVEGDFIVANQSLNVRIRLVQRLVAFGGNTNPSAVYIASFREGSIGVLYANLSISDFECEAFRNWTLTVYAGGSYTKKFSDALMPFVGTKMASMVGPCAVASFNITPTLGSKVGNSSSLVTTETTALLETIVPLVVLAFLLTMMGLVACFLYRCSRPERKHLYDSRATYTNRQPVYMGRELNLPTRRRGPLFIQGEGESASLMGQQHGYDQSDGAPGFPFEDNDELVNVDLLVAGQPVQQHTTTAPPYRLPPVCNMDDKHLAHETTDYSGYLDEGIIEMGPDESSEEESRLSPPKYKLPDCTRLL